MPNYAKIKALNDEFDQLLQVQGPKIGMFIAFVLLSVTGILFPIAVIVLVVAIIKKRNIMTQYVACLILLDKLMRF